MKNGAISHGTTSASDARVPRLRGNHAFVLVAACLVACSSQGGLGTSGEVHESDSTESTGSTSEGLSTLTRSESIALAEQWVTAKLQYCQAANGARDYDSACSSICHRTSNADWDPYRSDCSGFVSWAWELPAPGRVTSEFAPFDTTVSTAIKCTDMKPGDAANLNAGGHIVLFKNWITAGSKAVFIEEPGCSSATPYAHEFTSDVTCSGNDVDIAYEGETFTAIRYIHITDDPPSPSGDADAGDGNTTPGRPGKASNGSSSDDDAGVTNDPPLGDMPADSGGCNTSPAPARGSSVASLLAFAALVLVRRRRRVR